MEASMCIMGCQPIIISLVNFKKLIWVDVKDPLTNFWGVNSGLDSPSENFLNPTKHVARLWAPNSAHICC